MRLLKALYIGVLALGLAACGGESEEAHMPENTKPEVEKVSETYPNGFVKLRGTLIDGQRSGHWESFYPNGYRWSEVEYYKGRRDGPVVSYYSNGMMRYQGRYANDERAGHWTFYDTTGAVTLRIDMDEQPTAPDTLNHGMNR